MSGKIKKLAERAGFCFENGSRECLPEIFSRVVVGYDDRKNHSLLPENDVSGTGLVIVMRTFSNEMEKGFSLVMEWMRLFLSEMDGAENTDYFISGRDG